MTRDEIRQIVWQELGRALFIVLTGQSQDADGNNEQIQNLFSGAATTTPCRVAYPWGFAARTPDNTPQLTLQMGNSPLSRVVAGHFDNSRPSINGGETILYNQYGQVLYLQNGSVRIGSQTASHPYVLGDVLNTFLTAVMTSLIEHTHAGPGAPPTNAADFTSQLADYVTNNADLSQVISGE